MKFSIVFFSVFFRVKFYNDLKSELCFFTDPDESLIENRTFLLSKSNTKFIADSTKGCTWGKYGPQATYSAGNNKMFYVLLKLNETNRYMQFRGSITWQTLKRLMKQFGLRKTLWKCSKSEIIEDNLMASIECRKTRLGHFNQSSMTICSVSIWPISTLTSVPLTI